MTERGLKTSTFFIQRLQTFFYFCHVFLTFFNVFLFFFLERFFYIYASSCIITSIFVVTSAKQLHSYRHSFVCLWDYAKTTTFTKFGGKLPQGPRKKRLDFDRKNIRITLRYG